jgi:transglutaminase-like putative cysteine protease
MTLWQRVVQANKPGPAEHSVPFRVASAATVVVAVGACWSQGELSPEVTIFAIVATVAGNILSYQRRERPWPAVKPMLAVAAVAGFAWFIATVSSTAAPGDISTVESPLAVLFAWVLSTHSFDVPARRDVAYSLAGSAGLMAVAAAQSVDLTFGVYVVVWVLLGVWGLVAMWQSMSGTRGVPWLAAGGAGTALVVLALLLVVVLPAPKVSTSLIFPSASPNSSPVDSPNNLTDGSASLPAHAASPNGQTRVGGFLGFAKSLDTGVRATLGNQVVMRVRASRPNFWVGQTYDTWNGQSWIESAPTKGKGVQKLEGGSPFTIPPVQDELAEPTGATFGDTDVQTFYLAQSGPNLVFHSDNAERVYIQSPSLYLTGDGTIVSASSMGSGTIYTVVSSDNVASGPQLQTATADAARDPEVPTLSQTELGRYLQLPHPYPRVAALARSITAGIGSPSDPDTHTYEKVEAIERWMSSHIKYTTDIPPLAPGADAVTSFLFGSRLGYCEQISTATVVMLRTLGIPVRETVGYVPGSYDPITDLFDVEAKDAHAWVQVWFPGYGWQNFDPTANVPLANPSPGSVLTRDAGRALAHLPWIPIGIALGLAGVIVVVRRRRIRRPPTWAHQIAADLERGGARLGYKRRLDETLTGYGRRLATVDPIEGNRRQIVASTQLVERYSYGGIEPSADQIAAALAFGRSYRRTHRQRRAPAAASPASPKQPIQERQDAVSANASSNDAPAASNGR